MLLGFGNNHSDPGGFVKARYDGGTLAFPIHQLLMPGRPG
jgi:hypothetical protein